MLHLLHFLIVIVLIDKTAANAEFVCQRHYAQFLINELGPNNGNNTLWRNGKTIKPVDTIVSDNTFFLE